MVCTVPCEILMNRQSFAFCRLRLPVSMAHNGATLNIEVEAF